MGPAECLMAVFSSTEKTTAFVGGAEDPMTSAAFVAKSGSSLVK
jgi:hypothetical protein